MKLRSKKDLIFHKKSLSKKASHRHIIVPLNSSASFLEEKTKHHQHNTFNNSRFGISLSRHVTRHIYLKMFSLSHRCHSAVASSSFHVASSKHSSSKTSTIMNQRGAHLHPHATVVINHEGKDYTVEVQDGETILDAGLEAGIDLRHDCKMGVCMMCPAKKVTGEVEQANAMLSDDVLEQGFVLLCCAEPVGEGVKITTVDEDELLEVQLNA